MPKLDSNIYGSDEQGFASGIANDALSAPSEYSNSGRPTGEIGAKGNFKEEAEVKVENKGGGSDSRACPSGNHGKSGCHGGK